MFLDIRFVLEVYFDQYIWQGLHAVRSLVYQGLYHTLATVSKHVHDLTSDQEDVSDIARPAENRKDTNHDSHIVAFLSIRLLVTKAASTEALSPSLQWKCFNLINRAQHITKTAASSFQIAVYRLAYPSRTTHLIAKHTSHIPITSPRPKLQHIMCTRRRTFDRHHLKNILGPVSTDEADS